MSYLDHTFALILAGGGGTRLWPKSRTKTPKQFLKLTGNHTMLQVTAYRFAKMVPWEKIIVVTTKAYVEDVKAQLPEIPEENILAEPQKRDTALAMLVGALFAKSKDPEAIVVNDAADHVVVDEQEFLRLMKAAAEVAADKKYLVSVGITPTYPSSAFGYIKVGEEIKKMGGNVPVFKVDSFTEKPNVATARAFISTGRYFWNANNYVWATSTLQEAFAEHAPDTFELTRNLENQNAEDFAAALPEIYKAATSISIDYAISEKVNNLVLIAGDFGWDDIGEWKVVYDLGKKDLAGNVVVGDGDGENIKTLTIESQNNLIHVGDRLVALVGVNDMIVVDTDEILMVAPKSRSQDVKKLVERLKEEGKEEYL
jgi:mannose-1-phosphate guanylyltransferase